MSQQQIEKLPFIIKGASSLSSSICNTATQRNLFFGTGLCTTTAPSRGLPFDVLVYILKALELRLLLGLDEIIHYLPDTHAATNEFFIDKQQPRMIAERYKAMIERFCAALQIERYTVVIASDIDTTREYQALLEQIPRLEDPKATEYARRQWCDTEFFRRYRGVVLKLGWCVDVKKPAKYDERYFDGLYRDHLGDCLSFVYTVPGRTFDSGRANVCPYTSPDGESRVLIEKGDITNQLAAWTAGMKKKSSRKETFDHLKKLVDAFAEMFGEEYGSDQSLGANINKIVSLFF
eukprot:TRINITY_DN10153_c0_g1_i1.p1 TRINITY_DN10153_c0_g1~~TRINITY_DN10153_c0_g1_i1.p1  ORF type:complete len:299 (+),score=73.60 TRINITY_DN10153_c0_g1_i1:22-897(+)